MTTVFALVSYTDYEGGTLHGVYSTEDLAEAAAADAKIDKDDWTIIHAVELDGAPNWQGLLTEAGLA